VSERRDDQDDWDRIDRLTQRVRRWGIVGIPTWLVSLALLHPGYTNLPLEIGFVMGCAIAFIVVVVDDRRRHGGTRGQISARRRLLLIWVAVFLTLALIVGTLGRPGLAVYLIPFFGATLVAGMIELGRQVGEQAARSRPGIRAEDPATLSEPVAPSANARKERT
jgi:hypothetical protein